MACGDRRAGRRQGIVLAEVLLAFFVLATAFLAVFTLVKAESVAGQRAREESTATLLARRELERLRAGTAVAGTEDLRLAGLTVLCRRTTGVSSAEALLEEATVWLCWQGSDGQEHTLVLGTLWPR